MKRLGTILTLLSKSTKLIKILKSAKALKVFFSFFSMILFTAFESLAMGLMLATALVVLLFLHELGHVIGLKIKGYKTSLPIFIPFVGAFISAPKFNERHKEAYVGYGGPLLGTVASIFAALPALLGADKIWWSIALLGIGLNLFNMLPISPLDGGRITQAVHPKFKYIGLASLLLLTLFMNEPGMLLIWILVTLESERPRHIVRVCIGTALWLLMVLLTALGIGHQMWANWIDVFVAGLLLAVHWLLRFSGEPLLDELDQRPVLSNQYRTRWLLAWSGLIAFQVLVMVAINFR